MPWPIAWAVVAFVLPPPTVRADASSADTLRFRVEAGARSDWTNEQFYEDTFDDTTFLARRLVETPETRVAAVLSTTLVGTRGRRRQSYQFVTDLSFGDLLSRGVLYGSWRQDADLWRWVVSPRAEYERDQTFGRDLERVRLTADTRIRRSLLEGTNHLIGSVGGELLRAQGEGSEFQLDRNAVRSMLGIEHSPMTGAEWRAAWLFAARSFPDSAVRDHVEHGWEADIRRNLGAGHFVQAEIHGIRRNALHSALDTRDKFLEAIVAAEGEWRLGPSWASGLRVALETLRYDNADSVVFFDYRLVRAQLMPRFEHVRGSVAIGPRYERLDTGIGSLEEYEELSGALELEGMLPGGWWFISPELGWREYRKLSAGSRAESVDLGAHSSYRFIELGVYGDQRIPGEWRVRLLASGRYEAHTQASDDSRSLYISLDVRKIF